MLISSSIVAEQLLPCEKILFFYEIPLRILVGLVVLVYVEPFFEKASFRYFFSADLWPLCYLRYSSYAYLKAFIKTGLSY